MNITRKIRGETADLTISTYLTTEELKAAHDEYQRLDDRRSMEEYISLHYTEEKLQQAFEKSLEDARTDIDLLASLLRRNIEEYGFCWEEARREALTDWVSCAW